MRNVIVVQLARFGDLIQSKRLINGLAAEEGVRVHLALDAGLVPLARAVYPHAELHPLPLHGQGALSNEEVFRRCAECFSGLAALDAREIYFLNNSPLTFALAGLFPPEICRGYARLNGQEVCGSVARLGRTLVRDRRLAPINLADLWAMLHEDPLPPEKVNPIPKPARSGRIGVALAGREARRSLPVEVLADVMQAVFQARGGPSFVLLGSRTESPAARKLSRLLPAKTAERMEDLTGKTTLADLPEAVSGLDMLLSPDTGIMHLAAHLGVPVQAFFLSSAWCFETGPYGFGHKVWQATAPCAPCLESTPCPRETACLAPFSSKGFLAHLAGKFEEEEPQNLMGCVSMLDDLGVTFRPVDGEDPFAADRRALRALLQEKRGYAVPFRIERNAAEYLYSEADWMLPPLWRRG